MLEAVINEELYGYWFCNVNHLVIEWVLCIVLDSVLNTFDI